MSISGSSITSLGSVVRITVASTHELSRLAILGLHIAFTFNLALRRAEISSLCSCYMRTAPDPTVPNPKKPIVIDVFFILFS